MCPTSWALSAYAMITGAQHHLEDCECSVAQCNFGQPYHGREIQGQSCCSMLTWHANKRIEALPGKQRGVGNRGPNNPRGYQEFLDTCIRNIAEQRSISHAMQPICMPEMAMIVLPFQYGCMKGDFHPVSLRLIIPKSRGLLGTW